MFIDRQSPAKPAISAHKKPVNIDWEAAVAEYLEETGATDLDAPDAPRRKTPRADIHLLELTGIERQIARAKAQRESREAQARLADGTAVLRQKRKRTPAIKVAKIVEVKTPKVRKLKAPKIKPVSLKKGSVQLRQSIVNNRLKGYLKTLKAGESIKMISSESAESHALYCLQRKDIVRLRDRGSEDIIRIRNINNDASYFVFDRYKRYNTNGLIDMHEPKAILRALMSGDLVRVDSIEQKTVYISKHVSNLASRYGFNIHAVYKDRYLLGWILLEQSTEQKELARLQKAAHLGGALQGLNYLKLRAQIRANMPGASNNDINDATWAECKRFYTDGQ